MIERINEIKNQIEILQNEILEIQRTCTHPVKFLEHVHFINDDLRWTDFQCKLCDKFWIEDKSL